MVWIDFGVEKSVLGPKKGGSRRFFGGFWGYPRGCPKRAPGPVFGVPGGYPEIRVFSMFWDPQGL